MDSQELQARVLSVVAAQVGREVDGIPMEKSFSELGLESLDAFEILFALEDEFGVDIPDESAHSIDSVAKLVEIMAQVLAEK